MLEQFENVEIKRVLIVSAGTPTARLTSRSSGGYSVHDSWEVFDAPGFVEFLRRLANGVERAHAAGNAIPVDGPK